MPMTTYVSEQQAALWRMTADKEINEVLQELRYVSGEDWLVRTNYDTVKRGWFRSDEYVPVYTLLVEVKGEYQVVNLCGDHTTSRQNVINYMLGYTAGTRLRRV